jgi:predicted DNA-binding protein YlxM (UPF0122 family)
LISKVSNEAINDNLKKRFENAEIYVRKLELAETRSVSPGRGVLNTDLEADIYRTCAGFCESFPGL